jgi:HEPN domain-containing protein
MFTKTVNSYMKSHAEVWIRYASDDLRAAEKLSTDPSLTQPAAFHVHQCVDKTMKALLELHNVRIPRTHNLINLLALIVDFGLALTVDETSLAKIDQVYVESRYPGDIGLLPTGTPSTEIIVEFIEFARGFHQFATTTISSEQ